MAKYRTFIWRISIVVMCLFAGIHCSSDSDSLSLGELYQAAVVDALQASEDERIGSLTIISEDNPDLYWRDGLVRVVTFTRYPDSYPAGEWVETWWGDTWVTVVPELRRTLSTSPSEESEQLLRIEQLLGLPHESGNQWFAELWVSPEDLFRPCPDSEITDGICELNFPADATPEHIIWFEDLLESSYADDPPYPWTRLGYTYDWAAETDEFGLSEFVIRQGAEVLVEQVMDCGAYLDSGALE